MAITAAANPGPAGTVAMWFAASDDGWAVNNTTSAYHWDGMTWTASPTGAIVGMSTVHGFASNDVWVGGGPTLRHWNGAMWEAPAAALPVGMSVSIIAGAAANDFWVGGVGLVQGNGSGWTTRAPTTTNVKSIAASATDKVIVAMGTGPIVYKWDGATLTSDTAANSGCTVNDIAMASDGTRFFAGVGPYSAVLVGTSSCPAFEAPFGGPGFGSLSNGPAVSAVAAPGGPIADDNGKIMSLSASKVLTSAGTTATWGLTAADVAQYMSSFGMNDVWVTGYYNAVTKVYLASHYDGAAWAYAVLPSAPTSAVGAWSPTSAWVLMGSNAGYWDGATWSDKGSVGIASPRGIWGVSDTDAWAVGDGISHWDGAKWTAVAGAPTGLAQVRGSATDDVVALQDSSGVGPVDLFHWNGASWSRVLGFAGKGHLAGSSATLIGTKNVWIPNGGGQGFSHWDGNCWHDYHATNASLSAAVRTSYAVGGSSAHVWALTDLLGKVQVQTVVPTP